MSKQGENCIKYKEQIERHIWSIQQCADQLTSGSGDAMGSAESIGRRITVTLENLADANERREAEMDEMRRRLDK